MVPYSTIHYVYTGGYVLQGQYGSYGGDQLVSGAEFCVEHDAGTPRLSMQQQFWNTAIVSNILKRSQK